MIDTVPLFITSFSFPEPKQFHRRLEQIFDDLEPSHPGRFAKAFLDRFSKDLAATLGTASIQLYGRSGEEMLLVETWGIPLSDLHREIQLRLSCDDGFPCIGRWDERMVAVLSINENADFLMVFFTHSVNGLHERFESDFASFYSALHYSLLQNGKRMEMQGVFEQARAIQMSLLPSRMPSFMGYDIAARSIPAKIVGGDVFDFQQQSFSTLGVTIGDASGHGFAAALQARDVITGLRLGIASRIEMTQLIQSLNRVIHQSGLVSRFVSLVYGELQSNGVFHYVNAGHPPPLLFHEGIFTELETSGMILGPNANQYYSMGMVQIDAGDILMMFTDGIIEHQLDDGTEFGVERLKALIQRSAHLSAEQLVANIYKELKLFDANFHDDATVVCVKRLMNNSIQV